MTADLKALAAEFDAAPTDGSWGEGHPIFQMAADVDRLRAQRDALADALKASDEVMATFQEDAVCDHSVGICWCDFNRARESNRALLAKLVTP